jgi:hypothetical protein
VAVKLQVAFPSKKELLSVALTLFEAMYHSNTGQHNEDRSHQEVTAY